MSTDGSFNFNNKSDAFFITPNKTIHFSKSCSCFNGVAADRVKSATVGTLLAQGFKVCTQRGRCGSYKQVEDEDEDDRSSASSGGTETTPKSVASHASGGSDAAPKSRMRSASGDDASSISTVDSAAAASAAVHPELLAACLEEVRTKYSNGTGAATAGKRFLSWYTRKDGYEESVSALMTSEMDGVRRLQMAKTQVMREFTGQFESAMKKDMKKVGKINSIIKDTDAQREELTVIEEARVKEAQSVLAPMYYMLRMLPRVLPASLMLVSLGLNCAQAMYAYSGYGCK
jgi:hypothetical protein